MAARAESSTVVFTCPACDREVEALVSFKVVLGKFVPGEKTVEATAEVAGLRVVHDCVTLEDV